MGKFYITTTLPYVNAPPHIGFALEAVQADIIARYHALKGEEVVFNTGTDEHGLKIYRKALEEEKNPQAYVDEYAAKFEKLKSKLNISYTNFIRTTDPYHVQATQEFWRRCDKNGYIEKKLYRVKYCVGCELEKTESELENGRCLIHPNLEIEIIEEENYFFKFSKFQKPLVEFYKTHPNFVVPDFRFNEIKRFVESGVQDFSISRLTSKLPWGVPVPGDNSHVMYVWFDALVNYISTLGWPENEKKFRDFWGTKESPNAIQIAGKDNLRQQSAMWQAMLMAAGLPTSKQILIHGFITSSGGKMSKSLGNVVDPFEIVEKYGTDALRFWLAHDIGTFDDGDFTWEKFQESYNANLANGLGNLVSRVMKMAAVNKISLHEKEMGLGKYDKFIEKYYENMEQYDVHAAINVVWLVIGWADLSIQNREPFKTIKTNRAEAEDEIKVLLSGLYWIAKLVEPFMPETSAKISRALKINLEIKTPLFPRIN